MNPRKLFTLTEKQKQLYQVQPDGLPGYVWDEVVEEYELPPYMEKTTLRFWYNTQDSVFTTHWHDAQEIIIPLETEFHVTVQNVPYCLQHHYAENITLEEAARKTALSKFYFTRIFKQQTGQTFYDYLSFLRIQEAESLLKDTSVPISEVAVSCGYANVSSFNRTFRRYRECSPQEYRSLYGHGAEPLR